MRRQIVLAPVLKRSRTSCGNTGTLGDCSCAALVDVGVTSNVDDVVWGTFVDVDSEYKPCGSGASGNFTDVDAGLSAFEGGETSSLLPFSPKGRSEKSK